MGNYKSKPASTSKKCHPKPISSLIIKGSPKQVRRSSYIQWSKYDNEASATYDQINLGEEDAFKKRLKVPYSRDVDVKQVLSLKRQTFQEFTWALILQELARLEEAGEFVPLAKWPIHQNSIKGHHK